MRRLNLGTSAVVLALLVTGCGDDDTAAPGPSTSPSSAAPTTSASPSSPPTSTPAPTSTVAPATGRLIKGPTWSLNAPATWTGKTTATSSTGGALLGPDITADYLGLSDLTGAVIDPDLDAMVAQEQRLSAIDPPLTRKADVVIAGMPAYHLAGKDAGFVRWTEVFGFAGDGEDLVRVIIGSPLTSSQAKRDATSAAVLASVTRTP